jgi:hypothetical protein
MLIPQRIGNRSYEVEQSIATRPDVCTVLYVLRRPEALGGLVVAPVEKRLESFDDERLVGIGFLV